MFKIEIDMQNDHFASIDTAEALAQMLNELADRMRRGMSPVEPGIYCLRDPNGNLVGHYEIER